MGRKATLKPFALENSGPGPQSPALSASWHLEVLSLHRTVGSRRECDPQHRLYWRSLLESGNLATASSLKSGRQNHTTVLQSASDQPLLREETWESDLHPQLLPTWVSSFVSW